MKKYNYMVLALVALLLVIGTGCNRDRQGKEKGHFGQDKDKGYVGDTDKLNLTTEQKTKLIDLKEKLFTDKDEINDEIVKKNFELEKLYLAEKPDVNAIDKAQDEIKALADKNIPIFREFRNNARGLLTEEQLKANPYAFMEPGFRPMGGPGFGVGFGPGLDEGFGICWERGERGHKWEGDREGNREREGDDK
jgi:Spy/CpxP family protein refolding chaperone